MDKTLFNLYERNLKENIKELNDILDSIDINNSSQSELETKIKKIENLFEETKNEYDTYQLESTRLKIDNTVLKRDYTTVQKRITEFKDKVKLSLLLSKDSSNSSKVYDNEESSYIVRNPTKQMQQEMERSRERQKSLENGTKALKGAIAQVNQDRELMTSTLMEMRSQRERLENMEKQFDRIDGKLEESNKYVKNMSKGLFF